MTKDKEFFDYSIREIIEILANGDPYIGADGLTDRNAIEAERRVVELAAAARRLIQR